MLKMIKYLFVLVIAMIPLAVYADEEGTCGDNIQWKFAEATQTLTLEGTGEMTDYPIEYAPWFNFRHKITKLVIKKGITKIGDYAFLDCYDITSVSLSNTITHIGISAFKDCYGLGEITIPASVTMIRDYAFKGCINLKKVVMLSTTPATIANVSFDCYDKATLYVPQPSGSVYETTNIWKSFKTIVEVLYFADKEVESLCLQNWDWNGDGFMSMEEVASVYELGDVFKNRNSFSTFDELAFFTGLTFIGSECFQGCMSLKSIVLPHSITTIGARAFQDCSGLTNFIIPASVTDIEEETFRGCWQMTSITIPDGVKYIRDRAFYDCLKLENFAFPSSLKSIGDYAFAYCGGLTTLIIPSSAKTIGEGAFSCCGAVSVVLPEGLKKVGDNWFNGCSDLTSITFPASVTTIGNSAFNSCSLTSLAIPQSITQIEEYAFANCKVLSSLTINNSELALADNAFRECTNLNTLLFHCNAVRDWFAEVPTIQNIIIGDEATSIETCAFKECAGLTTVSIGDNVKTIGMRAFFGCTSLTSISIGSSVTTICGEAFSGCTSLPSIVIPASVKDIQSGAFYKCNNLTMVEVGQTEPLKITSTTFSNSENATLYVPAACKEDYKNAAYWSDFKEIIEAADVAIHFVDAKTKAVCVENWDRNGDGELGEAEAAKVKSLGTHFSMNENITSFEELRYFTGLTTLDELAFYGCTFLKRIIIPKNVKSIAENCILAGCLALTSLKVDEDNLYYDSRDNCNAIIEKSTGKLVAGCSVTVIPSTVSAIGYGAFSYYTNLTEITIPNSITTIGYGAFCYSGLTSVTIPGSVTRLNDTAFNDGKGSSSCILNTVIVETSVPLPIEKNTFSRGTYANATLYVPAGCKGAYEVAQYWQDFKEIKEIGASELIPLTVGVEDVTVRLGSFVENKDAVNFDFENGETMWGWGNDQTMGIAEGSYNGSKYQTTTNPKRVEHWENQIAMDFEQLVPGEVYVLHFWAKADKSFLLNGCLQYPIEEAGWPVRGDFDWIEIGTEWQEYTMTTTVNGPNATRLILNIGELDGGTFCLDDISLRRKAPLFKLTYEGFVDGDDETTAFTTLPVASTTATNESPAGIYPINISGGMSEKYAITYRPGTLTIVAPIKGDANNDGVVDMKDVVAVVNCLLGITSETFDKQNADMNNDGYITITDAIMEMNLVK